MGVLSTIKSGINLLGDISNALGDTPIKQFYSLRDFYNFIRKSDNCPMNNSTFFTVVPEFDTKGLLSLFSDAFNMKAWAEMFNTGAGGQNLSDQELNNIFSFSEYTLSRFALSIQTIQQLTLDGVEVETVGSSLGKYTYFKNSSKINSGTNKNTFTIQFYEMALPLLESFIMPWMMQCQKAHIYKEPAAEIPRLNLNIKFYRQDEIAGLDFTMNPNFVYRITGCFPQSFNLVTPRFNLGANSVEGRSVTFNYNNIMVFSNAEYERFITGSRTAFNYDGSSPVQILNKLNSGISTVGGLVNKAKSLF